MCYRTRQGVGSRALDHSPIAAAPIGIDPAAAVTITVAAAVTITLAVVMGGAGRSFFFAGLGSIWGLGSFLFPIPGDPPTKPPTGATSSAACLPFRFFALGVPASCGMGSSAAVAAAVVVAVVVVAVVVVAAAGESGREGGGRGRFASGF